MKICYADESGTGSEPIATMVGIVVDSQRMHVTKEHWQGLLSELSQIVGKQLKELHTRDFYSGSGVWRKMDGPARAQVITLILEWLSKRKHNVVFVSLVKKLYFEGLAAGNVPRELNTLWRFMGFHLVLAIQKRYQRELKTKGNTIIVFDNEEREKVRFTDLIKNPPPYSDCYYSLKKKQERLDQIIDVPYFADSAEVPLIQVADIVAFILRRYAELKEGQAPERYEDEPLRLGGWARKIADLSIGKSMIYVSKNANSLTNLFYSLSPSAIRDL